DGPQRKTQVVILSVKSGQVTVDYVRQLQAVVEREKAALGVLITLYEPTKPMRAEAAGTGFYESPVWGKRYPRLQILTVAELFEDKRIDMPPIGQVNVTFKKAPKSKREVGKQAPLGLDG
ncbi:MAG: site-specific DNA-methyltransferase, partial [Anaerolineae bacterium]|nr:site-specific DNA-methyltransferase [Anaerolineae bacterium]